MHNLGRIARGEVELAFQETFEGAGHSLTPQALDAAVDAIGGFPYMMQLVGYFMWASCGEGNVVGGEDARRGIELAQEDLRRGVLETTYRELSEGDRAFLRAMLDDDAESTLSVVAGRMGKSNGYASTYKSRLLDQGVIEELPGGSFAFALPIFREYVEELAARK